MIYVYLLLDPRTEDCVFGHGICFAYEPFYVGVTNNLNNRLRAHIDGDGKGNFLKNKLINELKALKIKPICYKYSLHETYEEAYAVEKMLIKTIGRLTNGRHFGPLCNNAEGGKGSGGRNVRYDITYTHAKKLSKDQEVRRHKKAIATMKDNDTYEIRNNKIRKTLIANNKSKVVELLKTWNISCKKYILRTDKKHSTGLYKCNIHGKFEIRNDLIKHHTIKGRSPCIHCRRA